MSGKRDTQNGSILVTLLFMTSILALLVAAVATDSFQSMKTIGQSSRDTQAKYAAYAGLEVVLNELRKNEHYYGEDELSTRHGKVSGEMVGLERLKYEALVWNNIQERDEEGDTGEEPPQDMEGPNGVKVRPDTVYIVASGSDSYRGEEVLLTSMAGTARRIRPVFEDAAFARTKLVLTGSDGLVDAWDSQGFDPYVGGSFPGDVGGGGDSDDDDVTALPNVSDYEATLGTDSPMGRTLRLLDGARLNGHYRVGPAGDGGQLFGEDSGESSGGSGGSPFADGGGEEESVITRFPVTTADTIDQVAGQKPETGTGLGKIKAVGDSKATEVPRFQSPVADDDVAGPVSLNNPFVTAKNEDGTVKKDWEGNPIVHPPAPLELPPGGYESVSVPKDQTLALSSGVYFFRDDFLVNGGKVTTSGSGPVIVFCGKEANFIDAVVNEGGKTSALQLCFTDDIKNEAELQDTVEALAEVMAGTLPLEDGSEQLEAYYKNLISPRVGAAQESASGEPVEPLAPAPVYPDSTAERQGFSKLKISGSTKYYGSISGANLVAQMDGGEIFGSIMGNVITGKNAKLHQDLALKGSNLMAAGGWQLESVHQVR